MLNIYLITEKTYFSALAYSVINKILSTSLTALLHEAIFSCILQRNATPLQVVRYQRNRLL